MALLQACNAISSTHKPYLVSSSLRPASYSSSSSAAGRVSIQNLKGACPQSIRFGSSFFSDARLWNVRREIGEIKGENSGKGGACTATSEVALSGEVLRWIFTGAAALLLFLKNTAVNKSILVPLLALQAPRDVVTWIRGEYGLWAAFLALLVRLFYHIPGELELLLVFALIVITAPVQVVDFRGTMAALVVSAAAAAYLAYQHFSGAGGVKESFREGAAIVASLAVIILVVVPIVFFFGGF